MSKSGRDPLSASPRTVRQHAAAHAAGKPHAATFGNAAPAPKAPTNAKTAPKSGFPSTDKGRGKFGSGGAKIGGAK